MATALHLYDLAWPATDRWLPGDRWPRSWARSALQPLRPPRMSGLPKVTRNLTLGLQRIGRPFHLHRRWDRPVPRGLVGVLHGPLSTVQELARDTPCVTGVGVLNFPEEWPDLFTAYCVRAHVQASAWAAKNYQRVYPAEKVRVWPCGIETDRWTPTPRATKTTDVLLYDKVRWPEEGPEHDLVRHCQSELATRGLTVERLRYGSYSEDEYASALRRCRTLVFLSPGETQGIAYLEALSAGLPVLAWNPGRWLDPARRTHGLTDWPAHSVPYFDERCGETFGETRGFGPAFDLFWARRNEGVYRPREFVLETLTLEKGAKAYVDLLEEVLS